MEAWRFSLSSCLEASSFHAHKSSHGGFGDIGVRLFRMQRAPSLSMSFWHHAGLRWGAAAEKRNPNPLQILSSELTFFVFSDSLQFSTC